MNWNPEQVGALEAATHRGGRQPGSTLPAEVAEVVAGHLRGGMSISATARATGLTRDRVRTVKLAMYGLTLGQYRSLKSGLRP